jgi:hypothetical protein
MATPALDPIILPPGEYRQLDVLLDERDEEYAINYGDWMYNSSIVVDANYSDTQDYLHLIGFSFRMQQSIAALSSGAIVLGDGERRTLAARFVVDEWMAGVNVFDCSNYGGLPTKNDRMIFDDNETDGMCNGADESIRAAIESSCTLVEE